MVDKKKKKVSRNIKNVKKSKAQVCRETRLDQLLTSIAKTLDQKHVS